MVTWSWSRLLRKMPTILSPSPTLPSSSSSEGFPPGRTVDIHLSDRHPLQGFVPTSTVPRGEACASNSPAVLEVPLRFRSRLHRTSHKPRTCPCSKGRATCHFRLHWSRATAHSQGKALFATYPVFRESILELDAICEHATGSSLVQTTGLFSKVDRPALPSPWPVKITLPALVMFQIAIQICSR